MARRRKPPDIDTLLIIEPLIQEVGEFQRKLQQLLTRLLWLKDKCYPLADRLKPGEKQD